MKTEIKSFPMVTEDNVSWNIIDVLGITNTVLTLSRKACTLAVIKLGLDHSSEGEVMYSLSPYEYLCSDNFVNNQSNQLLVINWVIEKYLKWK